MKKINLCLTIFWILLLVGCAQPPKKPAHTENICRVFSQYPDWYKNAHKAEKKWGVPVPVQMAIIYQESSFNATARPPRKKLLWIIPWKRPSTAYGYSQALNNTWKEYERNMRKSSKRNEFDDAVDFICWYSHQANRKLGINPKNAYALYLAYHEGAGGYSRHSYLKKPWLIGVAHKVSYRADTYTRQLAMCERYFQ